jgi:hypothetical protein
MIFHLVGGRFGETDAFMYTIARRSRKTWVDGDLVEAGATHSFFGSERSKAGFIQVATYFQKAMPCRQSSISRLADGASTEMDMLRLELTLSSI